ncbi:putative F-box protein At1g67623 [Chenopodium quinoa]|uniref:putative F-box protein At1g67623 n=1 Tax=Chenopodium quinoa TaxID=63459 RepID=UPI000B78AE25|nr:putative F-box protein At1g67623 [Chenopodium quinoa]
MDVEAKRKFSPSIVDILPPDVLANILSCVARSSPADLFRRKLSCKTLRLIAEEKGVVQQIHLPWVKARMSGISRNKANRFWKKCVQNEHPEALLEYGLLVNDGLTTLVRATELHNSMADYVLSLIYIYTGQEESGVSLLEKTINRIGSGGIV